MVFGADGLLEGRQQKLRRTVHNLATFSRVFIDTIGSGRRKTRACSSAHQMPAARCRLANESEG